MIRNIAAIAAVIIIMVLGVKYMLGSVEEKAEAFDFLGAEEELMKLQDKMR